MEEIEEVFAKIITPEKKSNNRPSILIVEDDKDTQSRMKIFLEKQGYEITLAEDGIDAFLNLGGKSFDLILTDINMPHLDGLKLLEMKKQKGIEIPVIFLTARTDLEAEKRGLDLGAADYIKKPIKEDLLLNRVKKVLENARGNPASFGVN